MSILRPSEFEYLRFRELPSRAALRDAASGGCPLIPGSWMAGGFLASCAAVWLLMLAAGLRIELTALSTAYVALAIVAGGACYRLRDAREGGAQMARNLIETFALCTCISVLGALATYPLSALTSGFADPLLQRADVALHFDWLGWYGVVAAHPALQQIEQAAYLSIFVTPTILLFFFAWEGRLAEARMLIATLWLAAAITLALFVFVPAQGPLIYLSHGHIPYLPFSGLHEEQDIWALRRHLMPVVDLGALHGLVSAPSFHAASGVLFIAFGWRIARLRWPLTALNTVLLLATPVEGTHYLIDIVAGALVAIVALKAMPWLVHGAFAWRERRDGGGQALATTR